MTVKRIVANIAVEDAAKARAFHGDVRGLSVAMDLGWFVTYASTEDAKAQVSFATEGGSGAPVPDLSVDDDDVAPVLERARKAGFAIVHGPAEEPWGTVRLFVRDPFGRVVNVAAHL